MRARLFFLFLVAITVSVKSYSQGIYDDKPYTFEVGGGIGAMNCITDLGGANGLSKYYVNEIKLKNFKFSATFYASAIYYHFLGVRLEATRGQVQSADADIKGNSIVPAYKRNRNLSFKTDITEVALSFQFHPMILVNLDESAVILDPYISAGVGLFTFNPQTFYNGRWVNLKPLHTEGQGFPEYPSVRNYKLTQLCVPLGIGVKYKLSPRFNLRLEYIHRILSTDYLDDASSIKFVNPATFDRNLKPNLAADAKALYNRSINGTLPPSRGNPDNNDVYMSLSLKVGIVLGRGGGLY